MNNNRSEHPARRPFHGTDSAWLLLLAALLLAGCGSRHNPAVSSLPDIPIAEVRVQTAEPRKFASTEEVMGTVRARTRATLEAKVSGRIESMPVNVGQRVKTGDLVARLNAPEIGARLEQAEASLQQAERDWKRISSLLEQQAVTRAEADAVEGRYLVAKGGLAEARAMLAYVEVRAPFDGVISRKRAELGDLALPGKPLVDLEDPSRLQVEAEVPEGIAANIRPEGRMTVRIADKELSAAVAEIAPTSDPVSRTFRIKLDLPDATPLMAGQFARLVVPLGESNFLRVPAAAVLQRGQLELAFVVDQDRARLHLVRTGRTVGDEVEVLSGLDAGDKVVTDNAAQLVDGQRLKIR